MKTLLLLTVLIFSITSVFSQGATCADAEPFCTGTTVTFPAGVNSGVGEAGNEYDCLVSQPNPAWYFLEIDQGGSLTINIENYNAAGSSFDIDFIMYGPYDDLASAYTYCGQLGQASNNGAGSANGENFVVDCSFSAQNFEQATIPNAQSGEVYILLITNFSNQPTNVEFTNTPGSTATTDCSILEPCLISSLDITVGACDPITGAFQIDGEVSFQDPPSIGDLIAEDCNGNSVVIASAPFNQLTETFTLSGITADGQNCNLTVYFSSEPSCDIAINYTNPASCAPLCLVTDFFVDLSLGNCESNWEVEGYVDFENAPGAGDLVVEDCEGNSVVVASFPFPATGPINYSFTGPLATETGSTCEFRAYFTANQGCESIISVDLPAANLPDDAGTISYAFNGDGTIPYALCVGDELTILSNGDWSIPPIAPGNDPSVVFFLYSCPPSPGGIGIDPTDDPCFEGFIGAPGVIIENIGSGTPVPNTTNNTFYVVPMTLGTLDGLTFWADCYDLAIDLTTEVQFLNEITYDVSESCSNGSLTISNLQGGYPEFHGGNFTGSNLLPASASFVNSSATVGGQIVINGLVDGDTYSFEITDDNGCPISISGVFSGLESATISYAQPAYCVDETNPVPVVNGVQGGTFSSTGGLVLNPVSGEVNLSASTPGIYTVTYQSPDPVCFITTTTEITVNELPVVVAGNDVTLCLGESAVLTASGAANYVWDNGVVQGQPFFPTQTEVYTVIGTSAAGCSSIDQLTATVIEVPAPNFIGDNLYGCVPMTTTFTDLTGGNFQNCQWNFGDGQTANSCNTVVHTYQNAGCFDVTLTLTTAEGCSNTITIPSYVCLENDPIADFSANPTEITASNPSVILTNNSSGATSYEWDFGDGSGISTSISPTHVYSGIPNTYTITLTAYTDAGCSNSTTQVVVVGEDLIFFVPNAFTPDGDPFNPVFLPIFTSGFDPFNYNLLIFNRWGEVLFESNNAEVGWDGTYGGQIVQDGTYVWKITYKIDGVDKRQEATGHVTLIR